MKMLPLLVTASLATNAVLLAVVFRRSAPAPASAAISPADHPTGPVAAGKDQALRDALASGDPTALTAAGCPSGIVRSMVIGQAYLKRQERLRALQAQYQTDAPFWRSSTRPPGGFFAQGAAANKIYREFNDVLRQTLGDDATGLLGTNSQLSFLPATVRNQLQRIIDDYGDMTAEVFATTQGLQLPSDREKLALLQKEQERDVANLLGPELYEQYQLRTSPLAMQISARYGRVIQTEEEFRKIFDLQKAFEDQYPPSGGSPEETMVLQRARQAALPELQQQIAAVIGPAQMQEAERANEFEYRTLDLLTQRFNLPANTPDTIYSLRDSYAAESQEIGSNTSLTRDERAAQLRTLGERATKELQAKLGEEGTTVYAQRSAWLDALKRGNAFSTKAKATNAMVDFRSPSTTILPMPPAS